MNQPNQYYDGYVAELQDAVRQKQSENIQLAGQANSIFNQQEQVNLIEKQLDFKEELERLHHLLCGHELKINKDGNEVWGEPDDIRMKVFSDYGIKVVMNILQFYLNKNTLLSNYDDDMVKYKVLDFGNRLMDLIFMKYEEMFLYSKKTDYLKRWGFTLKTAPYEKLLKAEYLEKRELTSKLKMYDMICGELIDSIQSAYLRALYGLERESLRKTMNVSQTEPIGYMPNQQDKKIKWYNPISWVKR